MLPAEYWTPVMPVEMKLACRLMIITDSAQRCLCGVFPHTMASHFLLKKKVFCKTFLRIKLRNFLTNVLVFFLNPSPVSGTSSLNKVHSGKVFPPSKHVSASRAWMWNIRSWETSSYIVMEKISSLILTNAHRDRSQWQNYKWAALFLV